MQSRVHLCAAVSRSSSVLFFLPYVIMRLNVCMSVATTLVVSVSHLGRGVDVAGVVADLQGAEHGGQDGGEQRGGQRALQQVSGQVSNLVSRAAYWLENGRKLRLCKFCVNRPFKTDSAESSALDLPTRRTPPDLSESAHIFTHLLNVHNCADHKGAPASLLPGLVFL